MGDPRDEWSDELAWSPNRYKSVVQVSSDMPLCDLGTQGHHHSADYVGPVGMWGLVDAAAAC